jgi:hypothetical protein
VSHEKKLYTEGNEGNRVGKQSSLPSFASVESVPPQGREELNHEKAIPTEGNEGNEREGDASLSLFTSLDPQKSETRATPQLKGIV